MGRKLATGLAAVGLLAGALTVATAGAGAIQASGMSNGATVSASGSGILPPRR